MLKADAFNIVRRKKSGVARCAVLGYLNSKRERETDMYHYFIPSRWWCAHIRYLRTACIFEPLLCGCGVWTKNYYNQTTHNGMRRQTELNFQFEYSPFCWVLITTAWHFRLHVWNSLLCPATSMPEKLQPRGVNRSIWNISANHDISSAYRWARHTTTNAPHTPQTKLNSTRECNKNKNPVVYLLKFV